MMNLLAMLIIAVIGLVLTLAITPLIARYMHKIGKVGRDVHKIDTPEVAESGGIGFMLVYLLVIGVGAIIVEDTVAKYRLIIMLVILFMVTLFGLYDDFRRLSALLKPFLLVILATPIFFFRTIDGMEIAVSSPVFPFIGETRLTIVYWGLAIFVVAIPSNASNMLDVMNGVMSGSSILIALTAFITTLIIPLDPAAKLVGQYASLTLIGVLLGFWWYNRYPAKVFAGDTGSLGAGAAIGLIAIYAQIEFVLVIALLVHIMNSFSIISSLKGLKERHDIRERPVSVREGVIYPSKSPKAPITMVRLLVARKPLTEPEIVKRILSLVIFACILALLSAYFVRLTL